MSDERSGPATPRSAAAEKGQLQTLHRALDLLEVLAEAGQVTLSGLSEQLGLARTTTHRLLTTLTTRGYIRQDPMTGHYSVGIRTFVVGSAFVAQNPRQGPRPPIPARAESAVQRNDFTRRARR